MKSKKRGTHGVFRFAVKIALVCVLLSCQFGNSLGVRRIGHPRHMRFISRHYRDTTGTEGNDDETTHLRKKVDVETSLLESLLAYVEEQRKMNAASSPRDCIDPNISALVRSKVKRALAEEDYKSLYMKRVREDLAKTLGDKKLDKPYSDISDHLRKNFNIEAKHRGKVEKRELLNENYFKTLYIQKIADDIKSDLTRTKTKNIPVSKLNEIVKRELEDNFKSQYIAKVTNIVKGQLEQDLKQVAKRDVRWNGENAEWIRKELELLYKLEAYQEREKRQATGRNDMPADFKTLYIQRIADDVKREVVEKNMTNVSVNKLNDIVKRELEDNLRSDYVAKLTAFLKGQLEDTLRTITPDISRHRRQVLYVEPDFRDFLVRTVRDNAEVSSDAVGEYIERMLEAFLAGQLAIRAEGAKVEAASDQKTTNEEEDNKSMSQVDDDKAEAIHGHKMTGDDQRLDVDSPNPYLPAVRHHEDKKHHSKVVDKEGEERQRGRDNDASKPRGVVIDGVSERKYFGIEPFDKKVSTESTKEDEEEAKENPPYMLNYSKRDHTKEHQSDTCDGAPRKPGCAPAHDACGKRPAPPKKDKYCKVKVAEGGCASGHKRPSDGCATTCSSNHPSTPRCPTTPRCTTTPRCPTSSRCTTTPRCPTTHRSKCGGKAATPKCKPKCGDKAGNDTDAMVSEDFVRFEIFNVNIPTKLLNASMGGASTESKCGRRSSDGAPVAKHGVSLVHGNKHGVERTPLKVNVKGEKSSGGKTWLRRHNVDSKAGRQGGVKEGVKEGEITEDLEYEDDSELYEPALKELDANKETHDDDVAVKSKRQQKRAADDDVQESDDWDSTMTPGRRRLLSWEEEDAYPSVHHVDFKDGFLQHDLDVDWVQALAPHLSIRKRDLSTDPLNSYTDDADVAADEEDSRRARVKRSADGVWDDEGMRKSCFDVDVDSHGSPALLSEIDQHALGFALDRLGYVDPDAVGAEEGRQPDTGIERRDTDGDRRGRADESEDAEVNRYSSKNSAVVENNPEWDERGDSALQAAEALTLYGSPEEEFTSEIHKNSESKRESDRDGRGVEGAREKRNSDGSLCVLLKATIKEDDKGENETTLSINGKADYKLAVKNQGQEGAGNEATNLTMNGAANLNQEFHMPKQCPGEAMREISAELVEKLNSLGSCGGAEKLMGPQAAKKDADEGRRVGRVAMIPKIASKGSSSPLAATANDANASRRVGRVVNDDVTGDRSPATRALGHNEGDTPSSLGVEKLPEANEAKPRGVEGTNIQQVETDGKQSVSERKGNANAEKNVVKAGNIAPIADSKDVVGVPQRVEVAVSGKPGATKESALKEATKGSKVTRRSNANLYQVGLGKLLMAMDKNKVHARHAGTTNTSNDIVKLLSKVESALGKKDSEKSTDPIEEVGVEETRPANGHLAKRSVVQEETSKRKSDLATAAGKARLRDLMDSFGGGVHHDDEIGKRDLMGDLYESFGPVDADAEEFHVKKDLGPDARTYSDVNDADVGRIEKRCVEPRYRDEYSDEEAWRLTPRQRRWHPGFQKERDFYDDLDEANGSDAGGHTSRVQELVNAKRERGRQGWNSLALEISEDFRSKRHSDEFSNIIRSIVQSHHHEDKVAGFDGHGHYINPIRFLRKVPERRKRNYQAHPRRQLQPDEEDELIDADGQACGGRRQECDVEDEVAPRMRPEKMSTDDPEDPGDCDETSEGDAAVSAATSNKGPFLVRCAGLSLFGLGLGCLAMFCVFRPVCYL